MSILSMGKELYSPEIKIESENEECVVYKMTGCRGDGIMTSYQVFTGIELIYNDFHTGECFYNKRLIKNMMEINHCRQGRFECELMEGTCVYLEEGDLSVNMLGNRTKNSCFPLEHYHGVSVVIDLEEAAHSVVSIWSDISIDLFALREKLCPDNQCFVMRAKDSVEHIFSELYTIPDKVKLGYFKLKVLELLLFLSIVEPSEEFKSRQYFHKNQVDLVKRIKDHMTKNYDCHYTLEQLSREFNIPLTTMKLCFKGVYGTSIYSYMRSYRMQIASDFLCNSLDSISEIAGRVGYANASKFSAAFQKEIGYTPLAYRKSCLIGAKVNCME